MTRVQVRPWTIVSAVAGMHLTFAVCYHVDPAISNITALHLAHFLFGQWFWLVMAIVAVLSLVPMVLRHAQPEYIHLLLWPQQFMLFLMMLSALQAVLAGSYPDGTGRPQIFILTDQCYTFWLTLAHILAMVRNAKLYEQV